jgi:tetratricopeptide (TPR) repeat protein
MNMYEEALKYIKKAYDNGGNETAEILEHYGDILNALGRTEEAITFWRAAAKLDEDNNGLVEKIKENE